MAVHRNGPHGPTRGHGGWIPGYSSSLRHYPAHAVTVAFQINTDINTGEMVSTIERRLADVVIAHLPANTAEDR